MSIAVEDWDDLAEMPRGRSRRGKETPPEAPPEPKRQPKPKPERKARREPEPQPEPKARREPEPKARPKPEPKPEAASRPQAEPKPKAEPKPRAERKPRAEPKPKPRREPEAQADLFEPELAPEPELFEPEPPPGLDERQNTDFGENQVESLRLPIGLAAANITVWLLAHLSGVVELIGVSFAASVGMLLAAYILREWQRDRSALIYLVGALPLPITIISLFT